MNHLKLSCFWLTSNFECCPVRKQHNTHEICCQLTSFLVMEECYPTNWVIQKKTDNCGKIQKINWSTGVVRFLKNLWNYRIKMYKGNILIIKMKNYNNGFEKSSTEKNKNDITIQLWGWIVFILSSIFFIWSFTVF